MPYAFTDKGQALLADVTKYMDEHVYPNETLFARQYDEMGDHSLPPDHRGAEGSGAPARALEPVPAAPASRRTRNALSNVDYAPISEQLGKVDWASETLNCSAPDTGNMEILHTYGSEQVKQRWLTPLLEGEVRSAFAMTEPAVASSDATNIALRIERDGDHWVLNGRKWFTSGIMSPRCEVMIVMGKTDPSQSRHLQQSMIVVPKDTPGVTVVRSLKVFGFEHRGGHGEVDFRGVRVPADNLLGEEGGGFAISQARLGPGRIHHCMRCIGAAERALQLMVDRALMRTPFGKPLAQQGLIQHWIAWARIEIDMAREYVLNTATSWTPSATKRQPPRSRGSRLPSPTSPCA
jgi:acyl-CoA dehydrogenase